MFKKIVVALALVASNAFMAPVNSVRSVRVSMREIGVREVVRLPPALFLPTGRRSLPPPLHRRAPRAPGETGANSAARRAHPSIPFRRSADVEAKLKEIVAEQLGVEQASITAEASFASDLGADSLDVVEMARIPASFCRFRRRAAAAEPPNLTVARAAGHEDRGGVRRRAPRRARRGGPEPQRRRPRRQRPPVNAQNTEAQALPPNPRRTVFKYQR